MNPALPVMTARLAAPAWRSVCETRPTSPDPLLPMAPTFRAAGHVLPLDVSASTSMYAELPDGEPTAARARDPDMRRFVARDEEVAMARGLAPARATPRRRVQRFRDRAHRSRRRVPASPPTRRRPASSGGPARGLGTANGRPARAARTSRHGGQAAQDRCVDSVRERHRRRIARDLPDAVRRRPARVPAGLDPGARGGTRPPTVCAR